MAQFKMISHASSNWEDVINSNFSNVVQDSGAIPFNFVAPASGTLTYRVINGFLIFSGVFQTGSTDVTKIGYLPEKFGIKNFMAKDMTSGTSVSLSIDGDAAINVQSKSATDSISLDGVSLYVGYVDLTNLGVN